MSDSSSWLADRGLADPVVPQTVDPAPISPLPADYIARVRALELSIQAAQSGFDKDKHRVLQRASDFHAFLIACPIPEDSDGH